jgi:FkbM family methyltransferase
VKQSVAGLADPRRRRYVGFIGRLFKAQLLRSDVVKAGPYKISFGDPLGLAYTYREIFINQCYCFRSATETPTILDLGANIGIGVLYFKSIYPRAKIVAYEPDPQNHHHLVENIRINHLEDVEVVNKAVWDETTTLQFSMGGGTGSRIECAGTQANGLIEVEAVDIRTVLAARSFDFIKIDIEGAENRVLPACRGLLDRTSHLFLEYHSPVNQEQELGQLLTFLSESNFRVQVQAVIPSRQPYMETRIVGTSDGLYNIFAFRPS